ncbi:unnamed protein product [Cylindrotheca closterium]|uniref:Uncharacterized protein n=1 Tax=Cylindrotheca closterium TaxID=2856 RepID=A0AAD2GEA1_9STRA|nr:unnamed protein product [Cylindrotheca closterium]
MNYASRGEHDPKAERNNQHLKALFRVHFHRMPFKAIPKKLTVALMTRVAKISNYYPAKGVYMGFTNDIQEGHRIYDLNTKCKARRAKIAVLPMTDQVIKIIEEDARLEGVTKLRTYSKRNGELILDGDLLEGVDPDELWDENYVPVNEIERLSDVTLRNENIPDDELDELLMDAEADIMEARFDRDRNPR